MRLDHTGHQRAVAAVDHGGAAAIETLGATGDRRDAVALDEHLSGKGRQPDPSKIRTLLNRIRFTGDSVPVEVASQRYRSRVMTADLPEVALDIRRGNAARHQVREDHAFRA